MPISYVIDDDQRVIRETWSGEVSAGDLRNYWQQYLADAQVLELRRTIVDLRRATPTFDGAALRELITTVVDPVLKGRDWRTAIVVEKPLQFGISRQYQAFAEHYSRDAIFSDPESAMRWLVENDQERQKS